MTDENAFTPGADQNGRLEDFEDLGAAPDKALSPEAIRALREAQERRRAAKTMSLPKEVDGRDGEEPTRFGDWEKKGLAIDF